MDREDDENNGQALLGQDQSKKSPELSSSGVRSGAASGKRSWRQLLLFLAEQLFQRNSPFYRLTSFCLLILSTCATLHLLLIRVNIPTTDLFKTLGLVVTSYIAGDLFSRLYLPPVVGMYLTGVLFRNVGCFSNFDEMRPGFIMARYTAVSVVLTRSGLGLDANVFKKYPLSVAKLSIIPCTTEAVVIAIMARYFLPEPYPWLWALLFGFAVSAVSPTLTAQILSQLKQKNVYSNERLTSLYATCSAIDDIYCISVFAVLMSTITQTQGQTMEKFVVGLLQLSLGFLVGICWGLLSSFFPHKQDEYCELKRSMMMFLGGVCMYFGVKFVGVPAGGPLGCFVAGAMAAACFKTQGWKQVNPVSSVINNLWLWIMEPMLFGLVGVEIDLFEIELYDIALSIILITVGVLARSAACLLSIGGNGFRWNEKAFYLLAVLPKATVQAALGPQALDLFWETADHQKSLNIIRTSVLTVMFVTTASSIFLKLLNEKLLLKKPKETEQNKTIENSI